MLDGIRGILLVVEKDKVREVVITPDSEHSCFGNFNACISYEAICRLCREYCSAIERKDQNKVQFAPK